MVLEPRGTVIYLEQDLAPHAPSARDTVAAKTTFQKDFIRVDVIKPKDQLSAQKSPQTSEPAFYRIFRSVPAQKIHPRADCFPKKEFVSKIDFKTGVEGQTKIWPKK